MIIVFILAIIAFGSEWEGGRFCVRIASEIYGCYDGDGTGAVYLFI